MLNGRESIHEEKYLDLTVNTINKMLKEISNDSNVEDKEIVNHRKYLWDNRSELDEIEINENCSQVALKEQIYSKKINRIRTLERQLSSPYFARLDFKEEGEESESFYIGLSSVEEDYEFLVFDWRSPVASMFYDFETGPAYYEAPNRRVNGVIEFNRQFNIKKGKVVFMHDSNTSLCDESLTEMLGGNATDKMKNIVATIQKEQNDIIRNDESRVLFIQGAAGSGKTSIALHRAAYILYKYRKTISADNVLIFSPNEVFAEYISEVLPELGESNVKQTTFETYSKNFIPSNYNYESKNKQLEYIYSNNKDKSEFALRSKSMEYKNTLVFKDVLDKFAEDLPKFITNIKPIIIDEKQIINKRDVENTFLRKFNNVSFLNRIELIKESMFSQVDNKYLCNNDDFEYVEDKKTFYRYCKEEVNNQIDNMIITLDCVSIYKMLWNNIKKYTKEDLSEIADFTLRYLELGEVKYEDITPLIYIRSVMEGFRNYNNIKYILIDEAQDYSPIFYEIIKKSFKNASITIMGDLNQRIDKHSNVKNKEGITELFPNAKVAILSKSYRCTENITNFAKELLDTHEPIEAVERKGNNPTIKVSTSEIETELYNVINDMKAKDYKSIAVICKSREKSEEIYKKLKIMDESINLICDNNSAFKIGINVIPSYLSKGLEFDGVIIADGEEYLAKGYENLFYTVCTRALHELYIITDKDIKGILPKNIELYDMI